MSALTIEQRRSIDMAKEELVKAAEQLLKDAEVKPSRDFGHNQLRNLVAVASETESPAVVLNFIRYQMGRDNNWSREVKEVRLGDRFISALDSEGGVVRKALLNVPGYDDPVTGQLARMELIRYFLGFATRYMKYLELQGNQGARRAQGNRDAQDRRGGAR